MHAARVRHITRGVLQPLRRPRQTVEEEMVGQGHLEPVRDVVILFDHVLAPAIERPLSPFRDAGWSRLGRLRRALTVQESEELVKSGFPAFVEADEVQVADPFVGGFEWKLIDLQRDQKIL